MPRSVPSFPACLSTALAAGVLLVLPGVATATTTITRAGQTATLIGDDAPSRIVSFGSNAFQFRDELGGAVVAAAGCTQLDFSSVHCNAYGKEDSFGASTAIVAKLGGGDDFYKYAIYDGPQTVDGEGGNDTIETSNGKDVVTGGPGSDDLNGGRGDDVLDGGEGNDTVDGWDGSDTVSGGPGVDKLLGDGATVYAGGSDTLLARDGEGDSVDCGGGADRAEVDALDVVAGCATVDRPVVVGPTPTPVPTPVPGPTPGPVTKLSVAGSVTKKLTPSALAKGKKVTVSLTATAACQGRVAIAVTKTEAKRLKFGTKALTLGTSKLASLVAGSVTNIDVAVEKKYRGKLAKASQLKTSIVIACAASATDTFTGAIGATFKK